MALYEGLAEIADTLGKKFQSLFSGCLEETPYTNRSYEDFVREKERERKSQNRNNLKKMITGKRKVKEWD